MLLTNITSVFGFCVQIDEIQAMTYREVVVSLLQSDYAVIGTAAITKMS